MQAVKETEKRRGVGSLAESVALAAACVAAGLVHRFVGQRRRLHKQEDELLLTKQALISAQHALKARSYELDHTKSQLSELRGELGSTKSQIESMRREMLLHKRSLDSAQSQLRDRDYEMRSSRVNGFWTNAED